MKKVKEVNRYIWHLDLTEKKESSDCSDRFNINIQELRLKYQKLFEEVEKHNLTAHISKKKKQDR